jgi:GDP-mannose 6-dehydrogenase
MNISVFGLGYVGSVSAACFAAEGHSVVGVDVNPAKVASMNAGRSPIVEHGLDELIQAGVAKGTLRATLSTTEAIDATDLSLICVGTPSRRNGSLDLTYLERVCEQIGQALRPRPGYHVVVVRSTMLPGTTHDVLIPLLERSSGKQYGSGFGVTVNPEFLREGTALQDFQNPPMTLVGHNYVSDARAVEALYTNIDAPCVTTDIRTAEMVKYASNTWHALKVCFANEIGNLCKKLAIDSHELMDLFCRDGKLNLSSYYLKPGFAFGGSCLPKDIRAMQHRAKEMDLEMPVIQSILPSNQLQIRHALDLIIENGGKRIGLLGFSFKAGTDDLRESPIVILAEALLGKGYQLRIYDKSVLMARLVGANKEYIDQQIPHLSSLLCDTVDAVLDESDLVVVGNAAPEFADALRRTRSDQVVIDLVRAGVPREEIPARYVGLCW